MKNCFPHIFALFTLVLLTGCASYAPKNNDLSLVISKTQQTMTSLAEKLKVSDNDTLLEEYNKVKTTSKELFPLLIQCNEKYALTPEYVSALQEAQKTLDRLVKNFDTADNKKFMLNAIYQDYNAKLQTINNTAQNDATTKIKVLVNSNEEEGFFVFGKLSYEKEQRIKRFRFNRPTQNASQDFVPGYYLFWLEKDDRIGEPELHLILSNEGEEEKTLVLKAPKL